MYAGSLRRFAGACSIAFGILASVPATAQTPPSPTPSPTPAPNAPPVEENIVVSATKIDQPEVDVPHAVTVVSGEELARRGTRTVADALQDVVGLQTGNGSDNGPRIPNIGLYGIQEFDALEVMLDGVPVGGPFNPNLAMIPVEDIDRIEVVRGPSGTLYGVSAFAGMVNIFTRHDTGGTWGSARVGGFGAFASGWGDVFVGHEVAPGFTLRLNGSIQQGGGWQEATNFKRDQLRLSADNVWGQTRMTTSFLYLRDTNFWGSPLPVEPETGEVFPGFEPDLNYAVGNARVDHHVVGLFNTISTPLSSTVTFENVLGVTRDKG